MKKGEKYLGREILHIETFPPAGTFKAYYAAEGRLKRLGYVTGSMCRQEPIGFADEDKYDYIAKWYNMNQTEKGMLEGVMVSDDFREGEVSLIFFTEPKKIEGFRVGDLVEFVADNNVLRDTIAYIGEGKIEGKIFDLTYQDLTLI